MVVILLLQALMLPAIIWDGSTGANLHTLRRHANKIWDVSWSPDGNQLATASEDRTAIIWDVKSGSITLYSKKSFKLFMEYQLGS